MHFSMGDFSSRKVECLIATTFVFAQLLIKLSLFSFLFFFPSNHILLLNIVKRACIPGKNLNSHNFLLFAYLYTYIFNIFLA